MKRLILLISFSLFNWTILSAQNWITVSPAAMGSANGINVHNDAIFATTGNSPHRSTDGQNWEPRSHGLDGFGMQGAGIFGLGSWLYYGSKGDIHRSNDDGETWTSAGAGITVTANNFAKWFYKFNDTYFCVMSANIFNGGGMYRSSDGINWTKSTNGISDNQFCAQMTSVGTDLYMGTSFDLFKSTDNGLSWTAFPTTGLGLHNGIIEYNGRLLVLTNFDIKYSDDNGNSWQTAVDGPAISFNAGFVEGANDTLYVWSAGNGIYYSTDSGSTWNDISGNLSDIELISLTGMTFYKNKLYIATFLAVKSYGTEITSTTSRDAQEISIFPNPFQDFLEIGNGTNEPINVQLSNSVGQKIIYYRGINNHIKLNTQFLTPGPYFLNLQDADSGRTIFIKKIINQ